MTDVTLALDLARKTGVVYGPPFSIPVCGTWELAGDSRPARAWSLWRKLDITLERVRPRKVYIEEPLDAATLASIGTTLETTIQLQGIVFLAQMVCHHYGIPTVLLRRQDVLQHFTGKPRYKEQDDAKRACELRCRQLGYPVKNWDEADAAALWDYGNALDNIKGYALAGVEKAARARPRAPNSSRRRRSAKGPRLL